MAETLSAVSPRLAATATRCAAAASCTATAGSTPTVAARSGYLRVVPDFVVLDELPVSEPVEPLIEPELVVSDEPPVVPLEPDPLMPVVPLLVEPDGVLPLPIVLPLPVVPDVEPLLLGDVDVDPLVLPGDVVERVDDELELPVSRPDVLSRSEQAPRANVATVAATATPNARNFICFIFTPLDA